MKNLIVLIITVFISILGLNAQSLQEKLSGKIDIVVARDGSGDFNTFNEAIAAAPDNSSERTIIFVKKGIYNERVQIPFTKKKLTIIGEDVQETVLSYRDYAGLNPEIYVLQILADDVWLMNLTIENKQGYLYAGPQALALNIKNCDRTIVYHCKLFSFQDTWYLNTIYRAYARDCFIEGSVDYIYGPAVAVFDSCVLFCNRSSGAVITAANTNKDDLTSPYNKFGFVFFNSRIMSMPGWGSISLGRPWRAFADVVYYKCDEGNYIIPEGWTSMHGRKDSAYFREFRCSGSSALTNRNTFDNAGALPGSRVYSFSLTDTNAVSSVPCFDSLFNPNVIPAKRGKFSGMWNPEESMQNEVDSVLLTLKQFIYPLMDTIGYTNTDIISLNYDTINIPLEPSKYLYSMNVDTIDVNQCFYPVFEYPGCGFIATRPAVIPGMGYINVVGKDRTKKNTYKIYFDKDNAFTNAKIQNIKIDTFSLPGFSPDVFEYHYELNEHLAARINEGYQITIKALGRVYGAGIEYINQRLKSIPDTSKIIVTAPDEATTNTYTIYFTMPLSLEQEQGVGFKVVCTNPINQNINCTIYSAKSCNIGFKLYNGNGVLVLDKHFGNQQAGEIMLSLNAEHLENGIYFYKIELDSQVMTGKLLKNK